MEGRRLFFTGDGKIYLKQLVSKYSNIIECKRTDCISVGQKKKAWLTLTKEFNAVSEHSNRTTEQLKKCWDNLKNRRKKELAEEKRERMTTGGGPYIPPPDDHSMDNILDNVDIELKDTFNSDAVALENGIEIDQAIDLDQVIEVDQVTCDDHNEGDVATEEEIHFVHENEKKNFNIFPTRTRTLPKYTSRGTAIERELEVRLERNQKKMQNEQEVHQLRVEQFTLKVEEQRMKVEEQAIRKLIAEVELEIALNKLKEIKKTDE